MVDDSAKSHTWLWIVGVIAVLAIVALLAYARRNPPFDDRVNDPEGSVAFVVDVAHLATVKIIA
jgi:hypothetical protein